VIWSVAGAALLVAAATTYGMANGHHDAPTKPMAHAAPTVAPLDLQPALAGVTAGLSGEGLSVAVLDTTSGKRAVYGGAAFDTASIVKVDILATLLLQAQAAGRDLTTQERAYATDMIENSDNDATSALWTVVGSAKGLDAANRTLGLSATKGGGGTVWGVTQTTAADQIRLLQAVFGTKSPLTPASRAYIQGLMHHIDTEQDWGVSAAAETGSRTALKNGWLQRTATKKWDVNSIGQITSGGRVYLMAVLLNGCTTEEAGIAVVEKASRAAVAALAATP
jgi:beta-lactamase class A